jgi:hypothetical protein
MRSFGNEFEASAARYVTTDAITTKAGHIQASALACPTDPRQFPSGVIIPSRPGSIVRSRKVLGGLRHEYWLENITA